ncbi:MAG: 16S rRNA (guanine(527)-N(7))-methyltransferase RsmG [Actinomycetia bacterium]|nr:16S rRNA (guanine(527)-N(7))-methyltransferase RsmG [Actinomycetes bacterium]
MNWAVATDAVPTGASVADVGSGAGLPGLVWAVRRDDLQVTLIEPLLRRADFLSETVAILGLEGRVRVVRSRAEDAATAGGYDVVTSRAVAPLKRLVPWCAVLCRPGGSIVAMKGRSAPEEVASSRRAIARVSTMEATVATYGGALVDEPTTVVEIRVDRTVSPTR